jgi:polysaccharide biosynthesis protein PelD
LNLNRHPRSYLSWIFELFILYALLLFIDAAMPGSTRLAWINPHPFWIPVLLLSVQYGIGGGLAAALSAIAINWMINWPQQAGGEDLYDYWLRVWREPILWLAAAIILGALRAQHMYKLAVLVERLADADLQRQSIASLCNTLKAHCEALERRIACAQDRTIEAGLVAFAALRTAKIEALPGALAAALDMLIGPAGYCVLVRRDGRLVAAPELCQTAADGSAVPAIDGLNANLEAHLLQGTRVLSILRQADVETLGGAALLAVPIRSPESERVLGALLIQTMDASHLGPQIEKSLQALCRELAMPLSRAHVVVGFDRERMAGRVAAFSHVAEAGAGRRFGAEMAAAAQTASPVIANGKPPRFSAPEDAGAVADAGAGKWSARGAE